MPRTIISVLVACAYILFYQLPVLGKEQLPVFVSIAPQKYFVQQIGKDLVNVQVMVPPGADPHAYEPKPRQMADLSKAKIYFAIGVPFENIWLKKIAAANPGVTVVHTDDGIEKIPMAAHHHDEDEAHHVKDAHGHREPDPHIWLSPLLVKIQAKTIMSTLQEMDPAHQATYAQNYQQFSAQIDRLDAELKAIFAGKKGLSFMVFHPSWGYFARAYGLRQMARTPNRPG